MSPPPAPRGTPRGQITRGRRLSAARGVGVGLGLAVCLVLAGLALAERSLRWREREPAPSPGSTPTHAPTGPPRVSMQRLPLMLVEDETCYVGIAPHSEQAFTREGTPLRHRHITDHEGFRVETLAPRRPAVCRVLAVGDSFTAGLYVRAAEAWPAVLEEKLRARGYRVQVDNGGLEGHSITQERAEVLSRWTSTRPRVAVVGRSSNDVTDVLSLLRDGCRVGGDVPRAFVPALTEFFQDLRLIARVMEARARVRVMTEGQRRVLRGELPRLDGGRCAAAGEAYLAEARGLARGASRAGTRVLFATFEHARCGHDESRFDPAAFESRLAAAVHAEGARSLDLHGALEVPEARLRPWDNHPSTRGHEALAEGIAADLVASGWLAGCR